ncbi:ThuA domain-containing protein [Streptomyces pseudovenezuelae]|uniref:Type 1 glutamine amidotransferase n=1 Tax=Streptomyces pseudovenezuelae TaxID=67350 RepID=A0ABT6LF00_9ACTN|nr:ThuA domain-containing protein [Streptomyces pseudovenezuelae]MDH6214369.1 type 1 glutamine amidotransferase [Streptomyces pseudovenezuelae]
MTARTRTPLSIALAIVLVALAAFFGGRYQASAQSRPTSAQELGDPDYGVCRGTSPKCYHDWGNFSPATDGYKVLLYTRTAGPRHANLGPALGTGPDPALTAANVVQNAVVKLGQDNGFTVDWTEDVTQLASSAQLFRYNAVIFYSTSRDTLDDAAQTSLRQYIRGGGGFVGIHNAFGTEYNWPWYEGLLGGANYYDHGPEQAGTVVTQDRHDSSTADLPARWDFTDEWYNLVPAPSKVRLLATVDESTLAKGVTGSMGHPGHGKVHPVAWCQYYDGGRAWLTTLGHDAKDFTTDGSFPGAEQYQKLILGGIESAMGRTPFCRGR